jgi:beta-lactamase superfamily II metal-dependent hydrolase
MKPDFDIDPAPTLFDRRALLRCLVGASLGTAVGLEPLAARAEPIDIPGARLTPWRPGSVDIHHIATGRGDSSLIIGPDGTSLMIDAGAMYSPAPALLELRPGSERRPGEWIARYVARRLRDTGGPGLDYLLVTHLHPDHLGDVTPTLPKSRDGEYRLSGVSDVASQLPIGLVMDRGYPDYAYPGAQTAPFAVNYLAFIKARRLAGGRVERFQAGAGNQIRLLGSPDAYRSFAIRNLAVNGEVWTGRGEESESLFPAIATLEPEDIPDENACSAALRLSYGRFAYFTAGDLTSNTLDGALPWRDVETGAARAAGQVDVAVAPHHALFDSSSAEAVRSLRARVWLIDIWHASQPSITTLERLFSQRLYSGPRDVFATGVSAANALVNERLVKRFSSNAGHIIVRVSPGGADYCVIVTDNANEADRVVKVFGPYESSAKS